MGDEPRVTVNIKIENNGNVSSTSEGSNGDGKFGRDFAGRLEKQIRGVVKDELVQQSRADGFLTQRSRFMN
jgi:hypothetical protein